MLFWFSSLVALFVRRPELKYDYKIQSSKALNQRALCLTKTTAVATDGTGILQKLTGSSCLSALQPMFVIDITVSSQYDPSARYFQEIKCAVQVLNQTEIIARA